jgi:hypothetical protein
MSDKPEAPLTMLPNVKAAVDMSNLNLAGVNTDKAITDQWGQMMQANEDYAKSLEDRYASPNWGKVSAALLKPQLGGFAASMGSAFGQLGEQTEQQRAVAPTIAQIRAQTSAMGVGLQQRKTANELLNERIKKPGGLTPEDVAYIAQYDKEIGRLAQEKFTNQRANFADFAEAIRTAKTKADLYAAFPKDFVDTNYDYVKSMIPGTPSSGGAVPSSSAVSSNKPPLGYQGTAEEWAKLPLNEQLKLTSQLQTSQTESDRAKIENLTKFAEASQRAVGVQESLYELAGKPGMEKVLGLFENGDPLGMAGKLAESGSFPKFVETARENLIRSKASEKQISDFNTLVSLIQQNINLIRSTQANPTNYLTHIDELSGPSIKDPQDAFRRKVALMLHDSQYHVDQYKNYNKARKAGVSADDFLVSPENEGFQREHNRLKTQIATNPAPVTLSELKKQYKQIEPKVETRPTAIAPAKSNTSSALTNASIEAEMKNRNLLP